MKHRFYLFLILVLASFISCSGGGGDDGSPNDGPDPNVCLSLQGINTKVINGDLCTNPNSPVVRLDLLNANGQGSICTGSVIGARQVLTAAHCFVIDEVISGTVTTPNGQIQINTVFIHPGVGTDGVNLALFNDVAVAVTDRDLNLQHLGIVVSKQVEVGDQISIQGFGLDENGDFGEAKGGVMVVSDVTDNHIFAFFNGDGQNSCNGDSGGPALLTFLDGDVERVSIVGVVSSGNPATGCGEGDVTLFANLQNPEIYGFIQDVVPGVTLF